MDAPLSIAEDLETPVAVQDIANVRLEEEGVVVDMAEEQEVEVATVDGGPVDPGQQEDEVATLLSDMTEEVLADTIGVGREEQEVEVDGGRARDAGGGGRQEVATAGSDTITMDLQEGAEVLQQLPDDVPAAVHHQQEVLDDREIFRRAADALEKVDDLPEHELEVNVVKY